MKAMQKSSKASSKNDLLNITPTKQLPVRILSKLTFNVIKSLFTPSPICVCIIGRNYDLNTRLLHAAIQKQ